MVDKQEPRHGRSGTRSNPRTRGASILQVVIPPFSNATSSSPPPINPPNQRAPSKRRAPPGPVLSLTTKKGARGKAKEKVAESDVPDIYQEMLSEALVAESTSLERPLKKRGTVRSQVASAEATNPNASDEATKPKLTVPPDAAKTKTRGRKQRASENPYSETDLGDDDTEPEPTTTQTKTPSLRSMKAKPKAVADDSAPTVTKKPASKSRPASVLKLKKAAETTASEDLHDGQSLQQPAPSPTRTGRTSRSKTKSTEAETEQQLPAKPSSDVPTLEIARAGPKSKVAKPASSEAVAPEPTKSSQKTVRPSKTKAQVNPENVLDHPAADLKPKGPAIRTSRSKDKQTTTDARVEGSVQTSSETLEPQPVLSPSISEEITQHTAPAASSKNAEGGLVGTSALISQPATVPHTASLSNAKAPPVEGIDSGHSSEPLPDFSNINFTSLAEKLMTNEVPMSDLGHLAPTLLAGEKGTGIKRSIEQFLSKQPFSETNPGFKAFSQSLQLPPVLDSDSTLQTPPSSQQTQPNEPVQLQLAAPRIPPHFNNAPRATVSTYQVLQGPPNTLYQQTSIPQLQVPSHTQPLQPSEYLQPFQGNAFFNTPYRARQTTQQSAVPPPANSNMVLPAQPGSTGPPSSSRVAGNGPPSRPVNETAQKPPANPVMPLPSSMQFQRTFPPLTSDMAGNGTSATNPQEYGRQQQATPRTQSVLMPRSTRPLKKSGIIGKGAATSRQEESAKVPGDKPNTQRTTVLGPIPPSQAPAVAQQSSKQVKEARRQNLKLPRRRPTVFVSRQHVELDPAQVKIKRDDVDLVLDTVAREFLEMDVGQARDLNRDKYTLILNNWQDKSGYVHLEFLPVSYSAQNGDDVGRILAKRAVETDRHWVLPALGRMMETWEKGADDTIAALTVEDHAEYLEWGMGSWKYTQLTAKAFFGHAKEAIGERPNEEFVKAVANRKVAAASTVGLSSGVGVGGSSGGAGRGGSTNSPARELIYKGLGDGGDEMPGQLAFGGGGMGGFEFPPQFDAANQSNPNGLEDFDEMMGEWFDPSADGFGMDPPAGGNPWNL
ncbi:hypothetical protein ACEPPN_017821 [Leptodophora sp. 'Broadleaf-Isolate-01']